MVRDWLPEAQRQWGAAPLLDQFAQSLKHLAHPSSSYCRANQFRDFGLRAYFRSHMLEQQAFVRPGAQPIRKKDRVKDSLDVRAFLLIGSSAASHCTGAHSATSATRAKHIAVITDDSVICHEAARSRLDEIPVVLFRSDSSR